MARTWQISQASGTARTVVLRGKPAYGRDRSKQGAYVVDQTRSPSIPVLEILGNDRLIEDIKTNLASGFIRVIDDTGNVIDSAIVDQALEAEISPAVLGPFFWAGAPVDENYLVGAAADGLTAKQAVLVKYLVANGKTANTVGALEVTVKNITTNTELAFTIAQQGAGQAFVRVTATTPLLISKDDKYSVRWSAVGATPGADWQIILRSTEGE